jgi:hypothetical protein
LLAGAAWGQSRTPTAPGPPQPLPSDKEDVKGQSELPLKESREQPIQAREGQAGEAVIQQHPGKPKSRVSRGKKPGAGNPTSRVHQDRDAQETGSGWWPPMPQPTPQDLSPLELSLEQDLGQEATPDEDQEGEDNPLQKLEKFENLPQELKNLIKSPVSP